MSSHLKKKRTEGRGIEARWLGRGEQLSRMKIDDYNCKVELALTSDGRTIVCYHPSVDIPYEHTKVCMGTSLKTFKLLLEVVTVPYLI